MDHKEAKRVKVGDRVMIWAESPDACTGEAIEVGFSAVKFKWDDGQVGIIHHRDMENVSRYYGGAPVLPAVPAK